MDTETSCPEYDSLLGGHQDLPTSIPVGDFINARIQEITALTEIIETPSAAISEMRSFPKHMRRRAMSHNIRRIPRRLRDLHSTLREKSNTREGPSKVPRRKYRRRPKELLNEYNRRQKKCTWLETHIWHAKRFKMINKWGYKLAYSPNDKSYRACYRAVSNHCLLQDVSYYNCIELTGPQTELLSGLSRHTDTNTGLSFAAQGTITGTKEGVVIFYKANSYPFGAVGEINFLWKPRMDNQSCRSIWLWCHPGVYEEFLAELIDSFNFDEVEHDEPMGCCSSNDHAGSEEPTGNQIELKKIELRNVPFIRIPKYSNDKGVSMVLLKDTLNRFRLTGPLSNSILIQCLKPVHLEKRHHRDDWIRKYYFGLDENCKRGCEAQIKAWSLLQNYYSPGQLTSRCVIPLTVIDPRFVMTSSRNKVANISCTQQPPSEILLDHTQVDSPLWSHSVRDNVTKNKLSTEQLNRMRSEKLVPGLEVEWAEVGEKEDFPCLPVILIQRPGSQESNKKLGYGSGWDVISPCGYGMPLWLSFVMSGARTGGLREAEAFSREAGIHQISNQPDTTVGKDQDIARRLECTEEFFRLPPAKRPNYIKLNIPTPFHCPWSMITKDWEGVEEYYVLRNKKLLYTMRSAIKHRSVSNICFDNITIESGALIPVRIDVCGKGTLSPNAHICLVQDGDVKSPPQEPQKQDHLQEIRSTLRNDHKKLLRNLARKRHTARQAEREEKMKASKNIDKSYGQIISDNLSEKYVKEHEEKMKKLWLPSCESIKDVCIRTIIGFVSNGDFCFTEGQSCGIGYVTLNGFKEYLKVKDKKFVLIRCTNSYQYRLATINVI